MEDILLHKVMEVVAKIHQELGPVFLLPPLIGKNRLEEIETGIENEIEIEIEIETGTEIDVVVKETEIVEIETGKKIFDFSVSYVINRHLEFTFFGAKVGCLASLILKKRPP